MSIVDDRADGVLPHPQSLHTGTVDRFNCSAALNVCLPDDEYIALVAAM